MNSSPRHLLFTSAFVLGTVILSGCEAPPPDSVQHGYRGTGMVQVYHPATVESQSLANVVPAPLPAAAQGGPKVATIYKNVQVLKDLDTGEFTRLMLAMTSWVAPKEGCTYCHSATDFSADTLYTKVVARRMLEMTRHINSDWKSHVSATGVTCYTCHRGQPVPSNIWFTDPGPNPTPAYAGNRAEQNAPAKSVGLSSLPYDPFTPFLDGQTEIRVAGTQALPENNRHSIKQTEWTYGLMMHFSQALGVNCTYCHNSRSFGDWETSTPQRVTAWHGIRMARDLNGNFLDPLASEFPEARRGPMGDGPKLNCATCHQGAYKPLYGVSMLKDYRVLDGVTTTPVDPTPTEQAPKPASSAEADEPLRQPALASSDSYVSNKSAMSQDPSRRGSGTSP